MRRARSLGNWRCVLGEPFLCIIVSMAPCAHSCEHDRLTASLRRANLAPDDMTHMAMLRAKITVDRRQ